MPQFASPFLWLLLLCGRLFHVLLLVLLDKRPVARPQFIHLLCLRQGWPCRSFRQAPAREDLKPQPSDREEPGHLPPLEGAGRQVRSQGGPDEVTDSERSQPEDPAKPHL